MPPSTWDRHICVVYAGGTIGMASSRRGYRPEPGYLEAQMGRMPELEDPSMPRTTIRELDPLLDSAAMGPADWLRIAREIAEHHDDYDGFVVLHGTDTMAYTASALPFLLPGLAKPVVVTGSQIPLCEVRSDARSNLIHSLYIAATEPIPEVCLFFGSRLLRGCRSVKVDADGFGAFDSPNFPALGEVGVEVEIRRDLVLAAPEPYAAVASPSLERAGRAGEEAPAIGALRLFPGIPAAVMANALRPPLAGLVLEAYGVGNGPARDTELLDALAEAHDRGVVVVAVSQCLRGTVQLDAYATGSAFARVGVLEGRDLTAEAAVAKLFHLFASGHPPERVRQLMGENLRGEITPREPA